MYPLQKRVICLVETGWEGIRRLSIDLIKEKIPSLCIIKGKLDREVLEVITKYEGISLTSIRRGIFKPYIFLMFFKNFILGNTICIILNNRKNYPRVSKINKILGIKTLLLAEKDHDYRLFWNEQPRDINFILDLAKKR